MEEKNLENLKTKIQKENGDNIEEFIVEQLNILENRLYKGLRNDIFKVKETLLKQLIHIQSEQKEIKKYVEKLITMQEKNILISMLEEQGYEVRKK